MQLPFKPRTKAFVGHAVLQFTEVIKTKKEGVLRYRHRTNIDQKTSRLTCLIIPKAPGKLKVTGHHEGTDDES